MFIDEVKPGMTGYGLTVFSGTKVEKFDVQIDSVVYGVGPNEDTILARISGGPIEQAGVIAGMSGSPIYIDGRLIGALAYSWSFSKTAIAGITPIGEMLRIFDFDDSGKRMAETKWTERASTAWARQAHFNVALPSSVSESTVMRPIMTPVIFSGFSRESIEYFRPQLEEWGIVPVVGGSFSDRLPQTDVALEEGAAVGIELVRGDMSVAAIGTVTLKDGDRVLAFGHPFMLSGAVDLPMTAAYIHTILPSLIVSTKVSSALKSVGTLNQDRTAGVGGTLGGSPEMIPFTLRTRRAGDGSEKEVRFEIARNRQLLASLAVMALGDSLSQASSRGGEFTAKVHYEIEIDGFPTIRNDDFISGLSGFPTLTSLALFGDLNALIGNQFEELSIKSISMDVILQEAVESALIDGVRIRKTTLKPGEDIDLKIIMKPYMKDTVTKRITLHVPEHFPEGEAFVHVSAAPQTALFERMRAPLRFQPESIENVVKLVDTDYPGNRIDIRLLVSDPGIVVRGQEMPALPSSVFSVISETKGKEQIGITRASVMLEKQEFLDFEISGASIIPITIDRGAH